MLFHQRAAAARSRREHCAMNATRRSPARRLPASFQWLSQRRYKLSLRAASRQHGSTSSARSFRAPQFSASSVSNNRPSAIVAASRVLQRRPNPPELRLPLPIGSLLAAPDGDRGPGTGTPDPRSPRALSPRHATGRKRALVASARARSVRALSSSYGFADFLSSAAPDFESALVLFPPSLSLLVFLSFLAFFPLSAAFSLPASSFFFSFTRSLRAR